MMGIQLWQESIQMNSNLSIFRIWRERLCAVPSVRGQGVRLPLWRPLLRGLQGKHTKTSLPCHRHRRRPHRDCDHFFLDPGGDTVKRVKRRMQLLSSLCHTMHCPTMHCSTMNCHTMHCPTMPCHKMLCHIMHCHKMHLCLALWCAALLSQHIALPLSNVPWFTCTS